MQHFTVTVSGLDVANLGPVLSAINEHLPPNAAERGIRGLGIRVEEAKPAASLMPEDIRDNVTPREAQVALRAVDLNIDAIAEFWEKESARTGTRAATLRRLGRLIENMRDRK